MTTKTVGAIVTTNPAGRICTSSFVIGSNGVTLYITETISEYLSVCVSTLAGGLVATSTVNVVIGTNSKGLTYTSSYVVQTSMEGQISRYTTTYVTTSKKSVISTSNEVVVATNSVGSTYSTTVPIVGTANTGTSRGTVAATSILPPVSVHSQPSPVNGSYSQKSWSLVVSILFSILSCLLV